MINFKAHYVQPVYVKDVKSDKYPQKQEVSLVKLDSSSFEDLEAIEKVSEDWGGLDTFAHDIKSTMSKEFYLPLKRANSKKEIYAITSQSDKFEKIDSNKVLGMMQIDQIDSENCELDFIQVEPDNMYGSAQKRYKHIGAALISALIAINPNKNITVNSIGMARGFYEKLGFTKTEKNLRYIFKRF